MFKAKPAELPPIPCLADFPEHQQTVSSVETKRQELEACQNRLRQLRVELNRFDVSEMNPEKLSLQKSIGREKETELRLQKELIELEKSRDKIATEISAGTCRQQLYAPLRALLERHAEAVGMASELETTFENYVSQLEAAGFSTGHLPRPVHFLNLGRLCDRHSLINQILAAQGVVDGPVSAAPLKQKTA